MDRVRSSKHSNSLCSIICGSTLNTCLSFPTSRVTRLFLRLPNPTQAREELLLLWLWSVRANGTHEALLLESASGMASSSLLLLVDWRGRLVRSGGRMSSVIGRDPLAMILAPRIRSHLRITRRIAMPFAIPFIILLHQSSNFTAPSSPSFTSQLLQTMNPQLHMHRTDRMHQTKQTEENAREEQSKHKGEELPQ